MAKSLTETINPTKTAIGQDGEQVSVDQQELVARANAAGIQAPATPLGAAVLGAGEDSAKMAGTATQKMALQHSIQEGMDLQTAQRRQDATRKAEGFEDKDAQQWAGLADLGTSVQQKTEALILDALSAQTTSVNEANITTALEERSTLNPAAGTFSRAWELGKLKRDKEAAIRNRDWPEVNRLQGEIAPLQVQYDELAAQNKELGRTQMNEAYTKLSGGESLTPDELKNLSWIIGKDVGTGELATEQEIKEFLMVNPEEIQLANDMTAGQLGDAALMGEIATALGLDLGEVNAMSIRQLQDAIDAVKNEKFDTGEQLQSLASDPSLGPAERAMYGQMMEDFGSVSGEKAEQEFADLMELTEGMQSIEFNGKEFSMDEILNSEEMGGIIKDYFNNPALADELRETEPEFAAILDKHSTVLEQMSAGIEDTYERVDTLLEDQRQALLADDGTVIPTEVVTSILGREVDPDKIGGDFIAELQNSEFYSLYSDPAAFATKANIPLDQVKDFRSDIPLLQDVDPNFIKKMAKMSAAEVADMIRKDMNDESNLDKATRVKQDAQRLATVKIDKNDPASVDAFFSQLTGDGEGGGGTERLSNLVATAVAARDMGVEPSAETSSLLNILDADRDGKLDDPTAIQQRIANQDKSLEEIINNEDFDMTLNSAGALEQLTSGPKGDYIAAVADGVVDIQEFDQKFKSASPEEMQAHFDELSSYMSDGVKNAVKARIKGAKTKQIAAATGVPDISEFERVQKEVLKWHSKKESPPAWAWNAYMDKLTELTSWANKNKGAMATQPQAVQDFYNEQISHIEKWSRIGKGGTRAAGQPMLAYRMRPDGTGYSIKNYVEDRGVFYG